jgi:hypothetical protein
LRLLSYLRLLCRILRLLDRVREINQLVVEEEGEVTVNSFLSRESYLAKVGGAVP